MIQLSETIIHINIILLFLIFCIILERLFEYLKSKYFSSHDNENNNEHIKLEYGVV